MEASLKTKHDGGSDKREWIPIFSSRGNECDSFKGTF